MSEIKLGIPITPCPLTISCCPFCKQAPATFGHTGSIGVYCSNEQCTEKPCLTGYSLSSTLNLWNRMSTVVKEEFE